MRGGSKGSECQMPTVKDPFNAKSWQNGFKQIGCYWKQQDVKGLIPKPGGMNIANTINNALNYSSSTVNDVYEATDARNKEVMAKMDGTVASIRAWADEPVMGGKKRRVKKKASKKTASKKTASKKTASKKTASKKTASKKTASKKTASKKTASKKTRMRGGGGSDWATTVHSRGPVDAPDSYWGVPGKVWNDQFQKSGQYIPNSELAKGSYQLQVDSANAPKVPAGYDANAFYQTLL